jgi:arylsulfatase A-like enzyme
MRFRAIIWSILALSLMVTASSGAAAYAAMARPGAPAATGQEHASLLAPNSPNVLLITMDSTRADHIGAFGDQHIKTPTIDALGNQGAVFDMAITQFSQTNPSHASIFTGDYPAVHRLMYHGVDHLASNVPTLAQTLAGAGYATAGVFSWPTFEPRYSGLERGFSYYQGFYVPVPGQSDPWRARNGRADLATNGAINWLHSRPARPFFLWVHYQDPHYPYVPPAPFNTMYVPRDCGRCPDGSWSVMDRIQKKEHFSDPEIASIEARYDGAITFTDREVGRLLDDMRRSGALNNTIILLMADHGEAFNDNGRWTHPWILYNAVVHVPLIIVYPPAIPPNTRVDALVRLIDVMPTVLELAAVPEVQQVEGQSLMPLITGEETDNGRWAVTQVMDNSSISITNKDWKLIRNFTTGSVELYNMVEDPHEHHNLAEAEPDALAEMNDALQTWMEAHGIPFH